ncbi:hypothetical protein PZA11_006993 [Diplocarpon coronariae]|uniref:WSC domain-containing protein n=1 Tax=Diplocarpon coronariae TaxID=2795749 RepID=A0A218YZN9_9HELO|nr:hypothetical protein B2J93_3364 [Marssonina coronariae]
MVSSICRRSARLACFTAILLALCHQTQADAKYCSSFNTAETPRNASIYQSNSLCTEYCEGGVGRSYAYAIVSYQECYCSDYAPSTTTTGCDTKCPGWQAELCGGSDLYGYLELLSNPSGTRGPSSATPTQQATVTPPPSVVTVTATPTESTSSTPSTSTSTTKTSTSSTTTTSSSQSSKWTPIPSTLLDTAIPGVTRTIIATPTVPPSSPATTSASKSKGDGLGTGGAVGLTVGLVAMIALIVAGIFFWLRKRRQDRAIASQELGRKESSAGFAVATIPSRTMSENSRYVLGTDGRRVVENWEPGEVEEIRRSRLVPVDQRLDPFSAVYQRGDNKSTESINTIRDDHDYSRRVASGPAKILRATNPD